MSEAVHPFPVPEEAMEEHGAIIGKTGAGKTYTAKGFAERLLEEGARFCVIDPTGVWWGLKSSADGEREGFPVVVFGGDHGDVPLEEHDAEKVAEIVATTATPCVLDVSAFPSLGAQKRFMADFAEHVFRMNREALHLFVDEADAFMPQRPGPDETVMLGRWDTIARRGRSRGFRLTLITQRPAVLNKNALSQVGTLIALKLTSPQDRKAVGDWIEGNADKAQGKEVLASLPSLNRGEGWVWSPGHEVLERVQFGTITTWDSSRTPGKGEIHREAKTLARADISAILAKMGTPAAQKPGEVRTMPDADALKAARAEGYAKGQGEALAGVATKLAGLTTALRDYQLMAATAVAHLESATELIRAEASKVAAAFPETGMSVGRELERMQGEFMATMLKGGDPDVIRAREGLPSLEAILNAGGRAVTAAPPPMIVEVDGLPGELSPSARRMAHVLADRWPGGVTKTQWGTLASVAVSGGAGQAALKALREGDMLTEAGGEFRASETCRAWAAADSGGQPRAGWDSEFAMWCAHLESTPRRLLEALRDLGGAATRSALATAAGLSPNGGATHAALKALRDNGLLTSRREGGVLQEVSDLAQREAERMKRNGQ